MGSIPLSLLLTNPVSIEPTASATVGYINGESGNTGLAPASAPFRFGGNLYQVMQGAGAAANFAPVGGIYVYRSTDNGVSWFPLDASNGPSRNPVQHTLSPVASILFDGLHTIYVGFSPTADPLAPVQGPLNVQNFDLSTGTWGPVYGTVGSPQIYNINQLFVRPDGSIVVLTTRDVSGINLIGLTAHVFNGAWLAGINIDTGLTGGFTSEDSCAAVMDSAGNIDVFAAAVLGFSTEWYYQQFLASNALGNFQVLAGPSTSLTNIPRKWEPTIYGNDVVLGTVDPTNHFVTLFIGTPVSSPVFTQVVTPIDPLALPGNTSQVFPIVLSVGPPGILYGSYLIRLTDGTFAIRILATNKADPSLQWVSSINAFLSANVTEPNYDPNSLDFLSINVTPDGFGYIAYTTGVDPGNPSQPNLFYAGFFASPSPAPTPPTNPVTIVGGLPAGVIAAIVTGNPESLSIGTAIGGCKKLNDFDRCILQDIWRSKHMLFPPLGMDPYAMPWDEDFGLYPEQCVPINQRGGIVTPATAAGDTVVFSYRVPMGYDGLLTALYFQYSGTGFVQGSGDIIFRVQRNQVYVKDLGNVPFLLGSVKFPVPMTQGAMLQSNQRISLIVNVPNLSGNIQIGQSTVFGGLIGFIWPRG